MKKSVISLVVFLVSPSLWAAAPGAELKTYVPRQVDLQTQARYYQSQGNFAKSGNSYDPLPSGHSFEHFNFDFGARSLIFSKWAGFAELNLASVQTKTPTLTRSNSGLSEATVGVDLLMSEGPVSLIPEASLVLPLTSVDTGGDTAALGDGVTAVGGRMIALMKQGTSRFAGFGGLSYRGKGLSSLLSYGVVGEFNSGSVGFGAELRGTYSVTQDNDNEVIRDAYQCRVNGCAKRYFAMNPSILESNVYLKWAINREWVMNAGGGFGITGQNTSNGFTALAGLTYHWGRGPERSTQAPLAPSRGGRVGDPNFQEEIDDGVDQSLFEPPPPVRPAPIVPKRSQPERLRPAAPPRPQRPAPNSQRRKRQQIQNELDKTEMQIELKSINKKRVRP
mgnify:CR=1 FL=1